MIDNPEADPAKKGVIPSPETRVSDLTQVFMESDNIAIAKNPELAANNIIRFRVNATPEIQSQFKGYVDYTYDNKGNVVRVPPKGEPGNIIYDAGTSDFLIFDNQGQTYRLSPLTYEAQEN